MARVSLNELDLLSLTITIGCKLVSFPFDLPRPAPNADPKSSSIWDPVVERFGSELALWKKLLIPLLWWSDHPNQAHTC